MSSGTASSSQSEFSARTHAETKKLQSASQLGDMMFIDSTSSDQLTNLPQISMQIDEKFLWIFSLSVFRNSPLILEKPKIVFRQRAYSKGCAVCRRFM